MASEFLFVGFSVSEQKKGYFPAILRKLDQDDIHCSLLSMGGATFRDFSHFIPLMNFGSSKYVVFEIATCRRFKARFGYERYLSYLSDAVCRAGAIPCFFNLPRRGDDSADDTLNKLIVDFAEKYGFPCYSMYSEMAGLRERGEIDGYLRDGTHTTDLGAEFYADQAIEFMKRIQESPAPKPFSYEPQDGLWPVWIPPTPVSGKSEVSTFTRRGFDFPCVKIPENETVQFALPENVTIESVVTILGPRTGVLELETSGKKTNLRAYDRDCHYDRIAMMRAPLEGGVVSVTQLPGRPQINLKKGVVDEGPRVGEIAGFLAIEKR